MKKKKNLRYERPEDIIKPFDPIATDLIKQIYSACKDKNPENYTSIESGLVDTIERECKDEKKVFKRQINNLVNCTKEVLSNNDAAHQKERRKFLWQLEEIFAQVGNDEKEVFFEEINEAIDGVLQRNLSANLPGWYERNKEAPVFQKMIGLLNLLFDEVKFNMVPVPVFNSFTESNSFIVITTDVSGTINFVNNVGEKILKVDRNNLIGISINDIIVDFDGVEEFLEDEDPKKNKVKLISWEGQGFIPAEIMAWKIFLQNPKDISLTEPRIIFKLIVHHNI